MRQPLRIATLGLLGILAPLALCACSSSAPPATLERWRERVEQYVFKEANGDPNALRDVTWSEDQKGFTLLGAADGENTTDANALLLGHRPVAGRKWFIFLVGLVKDKDVREIRLAAMASGDSGFQWQFGQEDDAALQAYRQYRLTAPREPADPAPRDRVPFPSLDDAFELSVNADVITVTHTPSAAHWTLDLQGTRSANEPLRAYVPPRANE